jgi:hypothetical protein
VVTPLSLSLLALTACKQEEEPPVYYSEISTEADAVEVGSALGVGSVTVPVRVVNAMGAAVPFDGSLELRAYGLETDDSVRSPDGLGVANLTLEGPPQALEIEVIDSDGLSIGDGGVAWITGGEYNALAVDWLPILPLETQPDRTFAARGGVGMLVDDEVWWQPATPGVPAQRVLVLSNQPLGTWEVDVDADGLPDLALWNSSEMVLLRGHATAGYVWGWGLQMADGYSLDWLTVGDADGDNLQDLVMLIDGSGGQLVHALAGDGVWGFSELAELSPDIGLRSLTAGRHSAEGPPSLLVLADDYRLRQYVLRDGAWSQTGTDLTPPLPDDAYLALSRDLTGDNVDEALILEPPVDGGERGMSIINYGNGPTQYTVSYDSFQESFVDMNGDGATDIVIAEGGAEPRAGYIRVKEDGENFTFLSPVELDAAGPVAAGDFDRDGDMDLAVSVDGELHLFPGVLEDGEWDVAAPRSNTWDLDSIGPLEVGDYDGDGRAEVAVVRLRDYQTDGSADPDYRATLSVLAFRDDDKGALELSTTARADVDFFADGEADSLDIAACSWAAYAIIEDGGQNYLVAVPTGAGQVDADYTPVDGDRVACGDFSGEIVVAVGGAGGEVIFFDAALDEVQRQSGELDDLAPTGTPGSQGLATCQGEDCSVASADVDGDGQYETLTGGNDGTMRGWDAAFELGAPGLASLYDVDRDGWMDAVLTDTETSRVAVALTLTEAVGPTSLWSWPREMVGPTFLGDVDGDGRPEVFVQAPDGQLYHSNPER